MRIPHERLSQRILSLRILRVLAQNPLAFRTRLGAVGHHPPKGGGIAKIGRIASSQISRALNGVGAPGFGRSLGIVISQGPIAIGWLGSKHLAIQFQRLLLLPGLRQSCGLRQLCILSGVADDRLDFADIRIGGIDLAKAVEIGAGLGVIATQFGAACEPGNGFGVVRIGKQDLLPGLRREVHVPSRLERMSLLDQRFLSCCLRVAVP